MRNAHCEAMAAEAANYLRGRLKIDKKESPVGLVLGTGWGDVLEFDPDLRVPFTEIPGFGALDQLKDHARQVVCGTFAKRQVIALRGRVHLNERPADPGLNAMVRLQMEMLIHLGVRQFVLTCAVGSLEEKVYVGDIVLIDGFVTVFAPDMPLFAGEFCSPEDAIDQELLLTFYNQPQPLPSDIVKRRGHVMVRGPFFEGRKYDKKFLAQSGASVVGMSVLPEACIAALYPGVKVLPLAFVTNTASEEHSHGENIRRATKSAARLGEALVRAIELMELPL